MHPVGRAQNAAAIYFVAIAAANVLLVQAQATTSRPSATPASTPPSAVTNCHKHESDLLCVSGNDEYRVLLSPSDVEKAESEYTNCHGHTGAILCFASDGTEVEIQLASTAAAAPTTPRPTASTEDGSEDGESETKIKDLPEPESEPSEQGCHSHDGAEHCEGAEGSGPPSEAKTEPKSARKQLQNCHVDNGVEHCEDAEASGWELETATGSNSGVLQQQTCHFHAGAEHCDGPEAAEGAASARCDPIQRDYNVTLRIGSLFVILVASAIGVFAPILLTSFTRGSKWKRIIFVLKQFGTGVVISTAFIHLYTHATFTLKNPCVGKITYESTSSAIVMVGLLLSFLIDVITARYALSRRKRSRAATKVEELETASFNSPGPSSYSSEKMKVYSLEVGTLFHSLLLGLTVVVAGDSQYITLFVVVLFHQIFEGVALGACIAELPSKSSFTQEHGYSGDSEDSGETVTLKTKFLLALPYVFIAPLGMVIGISLLNRFNGNDPPTIILIGTLEALSAGILIWVGVVEMLAHDWVHGELATASGGKRAVCLVALVVGMGVLALLGNWV